MDDRAEVSTLLAGEECKDNNPKQYIEALC
jgi:hypothetical protein